MYTAQYAIKYAFFIGYAPVVINDNLIVPGLKTIAENSRFAEVSGEF